LKYFCIIYIYTHTLGKERAWQKNISVLYTPSFLKIVVVIDFLSYI
jgi:hypothetical protein